MSQRLKHTLFIGVLLMLLSSCTQGSNPYSYGYYSGRQLPKSEMAATSTETVSRQESATGLHTVSKGETLYSIAFAYGQDVRDVATWNQIRAPYTIYPEQQLRVVPPPLTNRSVTAKKTLQTPPAVQDKVSATKPASSNAPARTISVADTKISWQWPVNGKIIGSYSATDTGKKGVDIAGVRGQSVYAAADGRVVYSGSGLRGYGNLVIIKHNETFYSAYAHNDRIRVQEDAPVKKGQHIADMGSSGTNTVMLHFEVRRDGKPVDPLQYLPKRR